MSGTQQYGERLLKARSLMQESGLDCLIAGPSADLEYLLGAHRGQSERLTLLILPQEGPAYLVLPAFEATTLPELPEALLVQTWIDRDNPAQIAASLISSSAPSKDDGQGPTIGVGDLLWSVFLLRLQAELPNATFTFASPVLTALRQIKSPEEIDALRKSGSIADQVFSEIIQQPFAGRSELEVAQDIAARLKSHGLKLPGAPIVASGPNSASPHHHTGDRVIEHGDVVVLDFGGTWEGYYSDITRTVFVGDTPQPDSEEERVYALVAAAQQAAFEAARPGITCEALDSVARDLLTSVGYGDYFTHRLGHGIGLEGHEPQYIVQGNATPLQPYMSFTIEPGLYLPGKFGVRVEDVVYITDSAAERLNHADRGLVVVR